MNRVVGLDFDNTLVDYDTLFLEAAVDEGLLPAQTASSKQAVRDAIRALPNGEMAWRSVQARVYGRDIVRASPHPGTLEFLSRMGRLGLRVYVVSHKTSTASYRGEALDLRAAAMDFMRAHGFFGGQGAPLSPGRVFFESTRREKARRIASLGCTDFVDDLLEVFLDPSFPYGVRQLLYLPQGEVPGAFAGIVCRDWGRIADMLLGETAGG